MSDAIVETERKSIVFFHPDLGIGGAERLIIDAALGLQKLGHKVVIYTSHRDKQHCFDEARDGTLDVRVRGDLVPPTITGRFKILLTIIRHILLLAHITFTGELDLLEPNVFLVDQLSAGIPLMRYWFPTVHILFYCHFPDMLLVQQRQKIIKRLWRIPFDALEGWGMRGSDRVVVNSRFTRGVVNGVWQGLGREMGEEGLGVVYPAVDTLTEEPEVRKIWVGKKVILSINRFERKKDIALAIKAFAKLDGRFRKAAKLVIAGGYDSREIENVSYHQELVELAESLGLRTGTSKNLVDPSDAPADVEVLFLLSISGELKQILLQTARLLVYTPTNEHFGIVPLEAMLAGVPVLATNSGGPLETVVERQTGWLRDPGAIEQWTRVMRQVLVELSDADLARMGAAGKTRVRDEFSQTQLAERLDEEITNLVNRPRVETVEVQDIYMAVLACTALVLGIWGFFYTWKLEIEKNRKMV